MKMTASSSITSVDKKFFIFKTITILYVICLLSLTIVFFLKDNIKLETSVPFFNHFFDDIKFNFDFPIDFYIAVCILIIGVLAIPLYLLLFSFAKNLFFNSFLHTKPVVIFFKVLFFLFAAIVIFLAFSFMQDYFFTTNNSVFDNVVNFLYPETASEKELKFYHKIEAILFSIIAISNVYFLLTFHKIYKLQLLDRNNYRIDYPE
jgi:hypothetical protein